MSGVLLTEPLDAMQQLIKVYNGNFESKSQGKEEKIFSEMLVVDDMYKDLACNDDKRQTRIGQSACNLQVKS